jgi:RimJ/RimL family protein N-acetyltransferase
MEDGASSSTSDITVRPAREEDAAALGELRLEALRHHPEAFGADAASHAGQPPEFWVNWVRNRSNGRGGIIYVAVADEALVGMTGLWRNGGAKTHHSGTIWGVYVRPERRGQHIAGRLIDACLEWAGMQGMRLVRLAVVTTNVSAIRCYVQCGFRVYGVEPQVIYYDGVYYDELLMSREV